jgi:hypothetical protein
MTINRNQKGHIDNQGCLQIVLENHTYSLTDTVSSDSFESAIDVYDLNDQHVHCQFHLHDKACNQRHIRGFVVKLKNGNVALIGNCCAHKRLGLEHDEAANKFRRLENKAKLDLLENTIAEIQSRREYLLESLDKSESRLKPIVDKASKLIAILPDDVVKAFHQLAQNGDTQELVWLSVHKQKTEKGAEFSRRFPHPVAKLKGLNLWRKHLGIFEKYSKIDSYREKLSEWKIENLVNAKTVKEARKKINHQTQVRDLQLACDNFEKASEQFFKEENLLGLLYLIDNKESRLSTAQGVITIFQMEITPKELIDKIDGYLKVKWKCDDIQLHGHASQLSYQDYILNESAA